MTHKSLLLFGAFFLATIGMNGGGWAATDVTRCGAPISSIFTASQATGTLAVHATHFVTVPGARTVITVPAGATRCIKVRFSATSICTPENSQCNVTVADSNGASFFIPGQAIDFFKIGPFSQGFFGAHSFEWVERAGPGTHYISVRIKTDQSSHTFAISNWVMNVDVTN